MCNGVGAANSANQNLATQTTTGTGTGTTVANTGALATAGTPSLFGSSGIPDIFRSGSDSFTPSLTSASASPAGTPNIAQIIQSLMAFFQEGKTA